LQTELEQEHEEEPEQESDVDVVVIGAAPHVKRLNDISNLDSSLLSFGSDCSRGCDQARLLASVCLSVGQPDLQLLLLLLLLLIPFPILKLTVVNYFVVRLAMRGPNLLPQPWEPLSICHLVRGHGLRLTGFQIERINKCQSGSNRRQWSNE